MKRLSMQVGKTIFLNRTVSSFDTLLLHNNNGIGVGRFRILGGGCKFPAGT